MATLDCSKTSGDGSECKLGDEAVLFLWGDIFGLLVESCLNRVKLVPPPAGTKGTSHPVDSCVAFLSLRLPCDLTTGGGAEAEAGDLGGICGEVIFD